MPTPRRCSGCGAALGAPTDDDLTIVCTFCGLRHDINDLAGPLPQVVVDVRTQVPKQNTTIVLIVLAVVAVTVGGGLYTAYRTATEVTSRVQDATASVTQRVTEARRAATAAMPLGELGTLNSFGWRIVEVEPPPGGFAAFEPVAALPWAMTIGRAWASDAVVTRIDVGRVSATGVVDLNGEATSGYRFHSPARLRQWKQETDGGSKSTTATGLMLQIKGTQVRVLVETSSREEPATPPAASRPLPEILARARDGKGFGDRPFYSGYMIHLPRDGWVWYFSAPSGDSFPRARAKDGRVYPY